MTANILVLTCDLTRRRPKPKMRGKLIRALDLGDWKRVAAGGYTEVYIVEADNAEQARDKIAHRDDYGFVKPWPNLDLWVEPGAAQDRCDLAASRARDWDSQLAKHGRVPESHSNLKGDRHGS